MCGKDRNIWMGILILLLQIWNLGESIGTYKISGTSASVSTASRSCNSQKPCQFINAAVTSTEISLKEGIILSKDVCYAGADIIIPDTHYEMIYSNI